jgi:hypothetical protein
MIAIAVCPVDGVQCQKHEVPENAVATRSFQASRHFIVTKNREYLKRECFATEHLLSLDLRQSESQ